MHTIVLIAHNLRSTHNVGSLLRTADGLGVREVLFTGYTPYPALPGNEPRLPHIAAKLERQIHKTALGAEHTVSWQHFDDIFAVITRLRQGGCTVAALEQAPDSVKLQHFTSPAKLAIVLGREVEGVEPEVMQACDLTLEVPMLGKKESFNVTQAAAMALYHCTYLNAA